MSSTSSLCPSPINRMFNGRSVLITGASGFVGRVLLEKLLRTYQGIKRIYILMRPKKDMSPHDRLAKQLLAAPIFDQLKSMDAHNATNNLPSILAKIHIIQGDIGLHKLGISVSDMQLLLQDPSLSIVYHAAATVKFNEPLKVATQFNLTATKSMLELCKQLKHLMAYCHVSTAYVNSDIKDQSPIEEKIYPMQQTPDNLIKLTESLDDDTLHQIRPQLVGERPNTYTYTKALAENLVAAAASELPVVIVRPSIVVAAWKEPLPGWVDNVNGPTGVILAVGKGLLRSMCADRNALADIIPVDTCVNTLIAASYYTAKQNNKLQEESEPSPVVSTGGKPSIFHCTSGDVNPLTWGALEDNFWPSIFKYPSQQVFRYPSGSLMRSKIHDSLTRIFVHYLPALFIDLLCMIVGKKTRLLSVYGRLQSATSTLAYFTTTTFKFKTDNLVHLTECLVDPRDRQDLQLSIKDLDWKEFLDTYVLSGRRFVLKEKDETLDSSRKSLRRAWFVELGLRSLLGLVLASTFVMVASKRLAPMDDACSKLLITS